MTLTEDGRHRRFRMDDKKPLLCRLGWHTRIYSDSALFTSAQRCDKCGDWVDAGAGAAVDRERETWSKDDGTGLSAVLDAMTGMKFHKGEDAGGISG